MASTREGTAAGGAARESAAVSHVGRIRSNNQDSGYAGRELFVVADGMGGHAGGDVASSIAIKRIAEADRRYASTYEAEDELKRTLLAANTLLAEAVIDHPELTGMGTTVSAIVRVGESVAIAHIGDSRIYVLRDGKLEQVTTDHTFVQRLVDSGRITEEEAMTHPRRSVLMRVLGDVHTNPEIDTLTLETEPGDRWLICSDGLSGVVPHDEIQKELSRDETAQQVADRLIRDSLSHGAPRQRDRRDPRRPRRERHGAGARAELRARDRRLGGGPDSAQHRRLAEPDPHPRAPPAHPRSRRAGPHPLRARLRGLPRRAHRGGPPPAPPPPHHLAGGSLARADRRIPRRPARLRLDPVALLRRHRRRHRDHLPGHPAVGRPARSPRSRRTPGSRSTPSASTTSSSSSRPSAPTRTRAPSTSSSA
ncbi:PP2C family protein-serine/threonine phosphatase [Rathayibacter oskolensis]|uniref:PP2C family protein-serine/threonine phosphatase n=1 Tax=Rathayibacter oskolensis TaxID=1891671 RepID=UPI003465838F